MRPEEEEEEMQAAMDAAVEVIAHHMRFPSWFVAEALAMGLVRLAHQHRQAMERESALPTPRRLN